jgi:hypothetical protein
MMFDYLINQIKNCETKKRTPQYFGDLSKKNL